MKMQKSKVTSLVINRELLDPNFEGYKLALDSIPTKKKKLDSGILFHKACPSTQWSFEHVRLFSGHNHLWRSPFEEDKNSFYFFGSDNGLYNGIIEKSGIFAPFRKVLDLKLPTDVSNRGDKFNCTLLFPSPELSVISDGFGNLLVHQTSVESPWQLETSMQPCEGKAFICLDATLHNGKLDVIMERLEEIDAAGGDKTDGSFITILEWTTLDQKDSWKVSRRRRLEFKGNLNFCSLSKDGTKICTAASAQPQFISDSSLPVLPQKPEEKEERCEELKEYSWGQSSEDTCAVFSVAEDVTKDKIEWRLTSGNIFLKLGEKVLLDGELGGEITLHGSSWTIADNRLEVTLFKSSSGPMWSEFVKGDVRGEYVPDPEAVRQISERLMQFTSEGQNDGPVTKPLCNNEELEECDDLTSDTSFLSWIDGDAHIPSYEVDIGGHQILFVERPSAANEISHLCLRHDVDGVLWRLNPSPEENLGPDKLWEHRSTFLALGYVQASKTQRKFGVCSPDASYAAIVDWNRHAYLYWQPSAVETNLRNRKSGKSVTQIAKQHVIGLENQDEILGTIAFNDVLLILTETEIIAALLKEG